MSPLQAGIALISFLTGGFSCGVLADFRMMTIFGHALVDARMAVIMLFECPRPAQFSRACFLAGVALFGTCASPTTFPPCLRSAKMSVVPTTYALCLEMVTYSESIRFLVLVALFSFFLVSYEFMMRRSLMLTGIPNK